MRNLPTGTITLLFTDIEGSTHLLQQLGDDYAEVLLSQTTRDLVEHDLPEGVSLRDLGEYRLKDIERPSRLFQLVIKGLPTDFPPLKTLTNHLYNLPVQPTSFIGREKEVATVCSL